MSAIWGHGFHTGMNRGILIGTGVGIGVGVVFKKIKEAFFDDVTIDDEIWPEKDYSKWTLDDFIRMGVVSESVKTRSKKEA